MLSEGEKRTTLFCFYSTGFRDLVDMCYNNMELEGFVHAAIEFVRYLPNRATSDIQDFKSSYKQPMLLDMYINPRTGYGDLDAIAYILAEDTFKTCIRADIARIYTVSCSTIEENNTRLLAYNNVYSRRRSKWGLFE